MKQSEMYQDALNALDVLMNSASQAIDKSYIEELINNTYKEIITAGTLSCNTLAVLYTFQDGSVLRFTRSDV